MRGGTTPTFVLVLQSAASELVFVYLQEGSDRGLMGHIRAISNAHHCYWLSRDLSLFILDTILTQKLCLQDSALDAAARAIEESGPRAPRGEPHTADWAMEVLSVKEQVGVLALSMPCDLFLS